MIAVSRSTVATAVNIRTAEGCASFRPEWVLLDRPAGVEPRRARRRYPLPRCAITSLTQPKLIAV
jgi:hypothetical protein